ncbi:MAG: efflux RND transporter periplasmic adaptor subunit, partial [Acidobacteriota bacterium]
GELVTPEKTLFTVADLGEVWLWIDIYERQLRHVHLGDQVVARFDAWPDEAFAGKLAYIADELDPASRTVRARVDLRNPDRRLKPGMFARVLLASTADGLEPILTVPRQALQGQTDGMAVYVKIAETRFERRPVEPGELSHDWVEILSGLSAGEEVVTEGAFLLKSQSAADQIGGHHH